MDPEQGTAQFLAASLAAIIIRRRDEQFLSHELTARNVLRRQIDLPDELSLRRDLQDAALAVDSMPDVSINIDSVPVWLPCSVVLVEHALVVHAAVC